MSAPYYADDLVTLLLGDSLDLLTTIPDDSVDAVVTDPPYGLGFMAKAWDSDFTPGDSPMRRSAALDAVNAGAARQGGRQRAGLDYQRRMARDSQTFGEWCEGWARECLRVLKPGGYMLAFGGSRTWHRLASAVEDAGFEIRDSIAWLYGSGFPESLNVGDGRGTALKPAFEPIVVGRKPLAGTVVANVERHGTGALNIDACRTATNGEALHTSTVPNDMRGGHYGSGHRPGEPSADRRYTDAGGTNFAALPGPRGGDERGRWPTNVLLDDAQAADLDRQTGVLASGANPTRRGSDKFRDAYGQFTGQEECIPARGADSGGASRFFPTFHYEAKAPTAERPRGDDGTAHPTVKPLDLMRWLVRLVTPPGGLVLDPFLGSGTTAEACVIEGFRCIGIEREEPYMQLAVARLSKPIETVLDFGAVS